MTRSLAKNDESCYFLQKPINDTWKDLQKMYAVDLFSGGGGLSIGLRDSGFHVCAAVELEKVASETYSSNFPGTVMFNSDIKTVSGNELIKASPENRIDLIAACPPCQGFSSLTSKYKRFDPRNELIFQFVRIVKEVKPKAIMMENVPGLAIKGKVLFDAAIKELEDIGYVINFSILNVADYGVPQQRQRLVVLGGYKFEIKIPEATHSKQSDINKLPWVTVRDAIGNFTAPIELPLAKKNGDIQKLNWHVVRSLSERNIERLKAIKAGEHRSKMPIWLRPTCHQSNETGFSNVYGRMEWDSPSPTITGGCTTLSKGRFGHPSKLRTISVREAATLQSFPQDFIIKTEFMEYACKIIGNALPPKFASTMAGACKKQMMEINNER